MGGPARRAPRRSGVVRVVPLLAAVLVLGAGACSAGGSSDVPPIGAPAGGATAPTTGATGPLGSTVPAPPPVEAVTIAVDDPVQGRLTFDALAAGDPAAARDGRLVLFLHGFPETAEAYRDVLPAIGARGFYAVALTQRGSSPGARPEPVAAYGIGALVGDVGRVADALGASQFDLVGHDWGGAVAWASPTLLPGRVRHLLVLSTPHPDVLGARIADPADPQHLASAYMDAFRVPGSEQQLLASGRGGFEAVFGPGAGGLPADKVRAYADVLGTPEALGAALDWYRANPIPSPVPLGPVAVPTVYLWGAADGAFTRETAEGSAAMVSGPYRFVALPGRSHWLPEEAPGAVVAALLPLLDGRLPDAAEVTAAG